MRLLKAVNAQDSDKILKEIKVNFEQFTLSQKRFKVENVEIISGEKEVNFFYHSFIKFILIHNSDLFVL